MEIRKPVKGEKEIRAIGKVEARAAADAAPQKVGGYAAVFDSPTEIAGCFMEKLSKGCFSNSLMKDDARALWNHNSDYVIGRVSSKSLSLSEDSHGLAFEATPPDTAWAKDMMASISRGDVNQCSFGFSVLREEWDDTGEMPMRTILECQLYEVSPVAFPAYEDTSCAMRSLEWVRAQKKQADEAAAAEAEKRAAEKTAADAAAAESARLVAIGTAPVIGAKLRMKHAMRKRASAR